MDLVRPKSHPQHVTSTDHSHNTILRTVTRSSSNYLYDYLKKIFKNVIKKIPNITPTDFDLDPTSFKILV